MFMEKKYIHKTEITLGKNNPDVSRIWIKNQNNSLFVKTLNAIVVKEIFKIGFCKSKLFTVMNVALDLSYFVDCISSVIFMT